MAKLKDGHGPTMMIDCLTETGQCHAVEKQMEYAPVTVENLISIPPYSARYLYLNILVKRVYDSPESGLCMNETVMKVLSRGICQATHTAVLMAQIFQHSRLPSEVSR
jgi:hypothetical protein